MAPSLPAPSRERPTRSAATADPRLLWLGTTRDPSGHADELRGFLRALEARGHEPALREMRWTHLKAGLARDEETMLTRQERREPGDPCVAVHHYLPFAGQVTVNGAVNVARAMFETDSLPVAWLSPLLEREEVWVPSAFNVETFVGGGVPRSKLRVVGGTMDFDLFGPGVEPYDLEAPDDHFVFLTNFDFSERKGWRQLLQAWAKAFGPDDGVCLVLKTGSFYKEDRYVHERIGGFLREEFGAGARERLAPIRILMQTLPARELPTVYAAADAYVLASRGEGWGRPYMEAMATGLPTIASAWSGNTEFMNDRISWLVEGELVPVPDDAELFNGLYKGQRWFEPDVDALAEAMSTVARDPDAARAKAALARPELIERFGPDAVAARLAELGAEAVERHLERLARPTLCALRGDFGSNASLAVVNDGISDALTARGHRLRQRARGDAVLADPAPGVHHAWPPDFKPVTAGPTVVTLPWEYGAPPKEWVEQAHTRADRVWVYSEYVRTGYVAAGMAPGMVEVVPCPVDLERFTPDGDAYPLPRTAGCVFLFVGGTIWRKGIDILAEAWCEAFGPDDDVLLVIKDFGTDGHYKGYTRQDELRALASSDRFAPVVYIEEQLSRDELPALYRAADVVVQPYRGEGFCLPALEAMASGVPVVHNENGPTSEFVGDDCGWALPSQRAPIPPGSGLPPLAAPGYVHEIDPVDLADALRAVASDRATRQAKGAAGRVRAARGHSFDRIAEIAEQSLATLAAEELPLARSTAPAELDAKETLVLYAPDWAREDVWAQTLARWVAAATPSDPVTLALHLPDGDPQALAARIVERLEAAGHAPDALPDLALCEPNDVEVASLVAAADAVLLDETSERPETARRARRPLRAEPAELSSYVESRRLGVPEPLAAALLELPPASEGVSEFLVVNTYPSNPPTNGGAIRVNGLWSKMDESIAATSLVVAANQQPTAAVPFTLTQPGVEISVERWPALERAVETLGDAVGGSADDVAAAEAIAEDDPYARALAVCLERTPSAVVCSHPYLIRHVKRLGPGLPVVYEAHNVETTLKEAAYADTERARSVLRLVEDLERETCEHAALVVCTSEEDRQEFHRRFGVPLERMPVIPNGVDALGTPFRPWSERSGGAPACVFVGNGHAPNVAAAELIVEAARRLPDVRFEIVGSVALGIGPVSPPSNVTFHGFVPDDWKQSVFDAATLALNPMLSGSGTNVKVADYAAAGLPLITSRLGARGYEEDLVDCFVVCEADPGQLAEAIADSLEWDWSEATGTARRIVEERYDWSVLARRYAELLKALP